MRGRTRNQRGAGSIGCLFMSALIAAGCYAAFQLVMPTLRHNSFQDRLSESMPYFARQPEDLIRERVIEMASDFDIVLKPEQVKIKALTPKLTIDVEYEKFVDLKVWQKTLPFSVHRTGPY